MTKSFTYYLTAIALAATCMLPSAMNAQYWANETGGIFNIPSEEYNSRFHGYGSLDNVIYNKIDLQTGQTMQIRNAPLYDALGNQVAVAHSSAIGRDHDNNDFRDGGIIAASLAEIKVGNTTHTMAYAWSVNIEAGGRMSGWVKIEDLSPSNTIKNILSDNKTGRMAILTAGGINNAKYNEYRVISVSLPAYAEEYYIVAGRSAEKTAGKAKYYFTRDNYVSGLKNIPETGRQRYGVAHNNVPTGAMFYRDMGQNSVSLNIYAPSSSTPISTKLKLVWGYTITSAGEKIYSWINEDTLVATGNNDVGGGSTGGSTDNIAPSGTASQSSTAYGGKPSRAIDRNTSGDWRDGSVTHTASTNKPYWDLKWNDTYIIDEIKIYNRTNCCTTRLSNFNVIVYDDSGRITYNRTYSSTPSPLLTVNTGGVVGKHVRIQLNGTNFLSLAEVEVYGEKTSSTGGGGSTSSCSEYKSDNFNSNFGHWNDGGGDCYRGDFSSITPFTNDCIRLRDNTSGSTMTTDVMNLSAADEVNVGFKFYAVSMETGEDFFLEVSTNGGASYSIIEEWNRGTEFSNDRLYNESVTISSKYLSSTTVFRFRCDASANGDQVYIDDVVIETCGPGFKNDQDLNLRSSRAISQEVVSQEVNQDVASNEEIVVNLYPNPAQDVLNVELEDNNTIGKVEIYSTIGRQLKTINNIDAVSYQMNLDQLDSNQAYLVRITTTTGVVLVEKIFKL